MRVNIPAAGDGALIAYFLSTGKKRVYVACQVLVLYKVDRPEYCRDAYLIVELDGSHAIVCEQLRRAFEADRSSNTHLLFKLVLFEIGADAQILKLDRLF